MTASPARAATFAYVGNADSNEIYVLQLDRQSGDLTMPRGFNIDASGRYLLAVGQLSNALSSYRIDADSGKLTKLGDYPMGQNPNWVEIVDLP